MPCLPLPYVWMGGLPAQAAAVTPPAAADFIARYPAFSTVASALLDSVLGEAAGEVDSSWRLADQQPAIMAFAAHLLAQQGYGTGDLDIGMAVSGPLTGYAAGDTKLTFAKPAAGAKSVGQDALGLSSTAYGLRFLQLQARNRVPGALVV